MDSSRSLAVELLVDDGLGEGLKRALFGRNAHGEGADAGDEFGEFGVGDGERGQGCGGVVRRSLGAAGVWAGHGEDDTAGRVRSERNEVAHNDWRRGAGIIAIAVAALKDFRSIIEAGFDYRTEGLFLQILAAILNLSVACSLSQASDSERCKGCGAGSERWQASVWESSISVYFFE